MSSPTDLDGFLRSDDDNLTLRLANWFTRLKAGDSVVINVKFRGMQATSSEKLNPEPITAKADPAGVANLVEAVAKVVTERLGENPFGTLRIQGYEVGQSKSPTLDMQRTLTPAESGGLGEPNVTLLRALLAEERAKNNKLMDVILGSFQATTVVNGQLALALQQSATMRTASSASSDLAGLPTLLAFVALMVGWPALKRALGMPPDAPLHEVIGQAQKRMSMALLGKDVPQLPDRGPVRPPPGAVTPTDQADPVTEGEPESDQRQIPEDPAERAAFVFRALGIGGAEDPDPAYLLALRTELDRRPEVRAALVALA